MKARQQQWGPSVPCLSEIRRSRMPYFAVCAGAHNAWSSGLREFLFSEAGSIENRARFHVNTIRVTPPPSSFSTAHAHRVLRFRCTKETGQSRDSRIGEGLGGDDERGPAAS